MVRRQAADDYRFATANPSCGDLAACAPPDVDRAGPNDSPIAITNLRQVTAEGAECRAASGWQYLLGLVSAWASP